MNDKIPHGSMTISELQRIVVRMSNQGWVRWWALYNDTAHRTSGEPAKMAIQVLGFVLTEKGSDVLTLNGVYVRDFKLLGFKMERNDLGIIYTILRVNDDGTPFMSEL